MAHGKVIDRYMDAGEEPSRTLTPIHGYEKRDLVSLEQAVAEIEPPIDKLREMVWAAKRNSRRPADNLTPDESASIYLYTSQWPEGQQSIYSLLNQKLRSENRRQLKSWYAYLKLFLTALRKLPSLKKTIWRGIHGNVSDLYEEDFIWWGVSSCTETMNTIERFIGRSVVRTIFMIECINGKAIRNHSFHQDENEIILIPGTYLRVIDKWSPADNLYMIHLQEEKPPCELVAPPFTSLSPVETLSIYELTIFTSNQPNSQAAAAQSGGTLQLLEDSGSAGSLTVKDLTNNQLKKLTDLSSKLMAQFGQFKAANIHPLLYRPSFDISQFDARGNQNFSSDIKTYHVGPTGRTQKYTPPLGWTRYGFQVLGKYENDNWLHPFQNSENWYRAYHGTGRAYAVDFGDSNASFDEQNASIDAAANIHKTGFQPAGLAVHGLGIYCSPDPVFPEKGYVGIVELDTKLGKKTFKHMLQVAVNPDDVIFATKDIWLVKSPKNIRAYGILIKELN